MRKTWVKTGAKLFRLWGLFSFFATGVKTTAAANVHKPAAFTNQNHWFLHSSFARLQSVAGAFLPTFHTTYNNYEFNKLFLVN